MFQPKSTKYLTRVIKKYNYQPYDGIHYNINLYRTAANYIYKLTDRSTLWSNYNIFLDEVQIPFEKLCLKMLKHIEIQFIHIFLVEEILKSKFSLSFNLDQNHVENCITAFFYKKFIIFDLTYHLDFKVLLNFNSLYYKFEIASFNKSQKLSKLFNNYYKIDNKSSNLLDKRLLFIDPERITEKSLKVYCNKTQEYIYLDNFSEITKIPDFSSIVAEETLYLSDSQIYLERKLYKGFENFLILSLLAIQENSIDEIDYILNYKEKNTTQLKTEKLKKSI